METAEVLSITKNAMGTLSIEMKVCGMRKFQSFSLYPIDKETTQLKIQSSTRIARINLDGEGMITKSFPNGAYFMHLSMTPLTPFMFSKKDWQQIVDYIGTTVGIAGDRGITCDNTGAKSIFNLE